MESIGGPAGRVPVFPIPRGSFVFAGRELTSLVNELETRKNDGTFVPVKSPGDVRRYEPGQEILVEIMALGNAFTRDDCDTLDGLSEREFRWIALRGPVSLSNGRVQRPMGGSITNSFPIPPCPVRLLADMGHAFGMARVGQLTDSIHFPKIPTPPNSTGRGRAP